MHAYSDVIRAWLPWGVCAIVCFVQLALQEHHSMRAQGADRPTRRYRMWGMCVYLSFGFVALVNLGHDVYHATVPASRAMLPTWLDVLFILSLICLVVGYTLANPEGRKRAPDPADESTMPPGDGEGP